MSRLGILVYTVSFWDLKCAGLRTSSMSYRQCEIRPSIGSHFSNNKLCVCLLCAQINENTPWFCEMHPDPAFRSCSIPEVQDSKEGLGGRPGGDVPLQPGGPLIIVGQVCACLFLVRTSFRLRSRPE